MPFPCDQMLNQKCARRVSGTQATRSMINPLALILLYYGDRQNGQTEYARGTQGR
jgi:hypothetical protein